MREILTVNPENRPDFIKILEKPFLTKYIRINLVKQISNISIKKNRKNYDLAENKENLNRQLSSQVLGIFLENKMSKISSFISCEKSKKDLNENQTTTKSSDEKDHTDKHNRQKVVNLNKIESNTNSDFIQNSSQGFRKICVNESETQLNRKDSINISDNMTIEGKNSTFCKIEKLKKIIEEYLGLECFIKIYTLINVYYMFN